MHEEEKFLEITNHVIRLNPSIETCKDLIKMLEGNILFGHELN